jgi:hypothetical protein
MIKKLLFMGALLIPGVAYGGDPSDDLSVNIVAAGSAPEVPAAARAAGFTTLAANYDFSQPLYSKQSNWLDCSNNDTTKVWHRGWNLSNRVPCNIFQTTDPVTGDKVLDLQWLVSFSDPGDPNNNKVIMETTNLNVNPAATTDFPNAYYEVVYRVGQAKIPNDHCFPLHAFWSWSTQHAQGTGEAPIEWDTVETYGECGGGKGVSGAVHNWGADFHRFIWETPDVPASYDPTQYHTYALRITSNGTTQTEGCGYLDSVLLGCTPANPRGSQYQQRNFLIINNGAGNSTNVRNNDLYVKSIRVWSCADWKTTMCNGNVLTGAP